MSNRDYLFEQITDILGMEDIQMPRQKIIKKPETEQRESIPANIFYRVVSQTQGNVLPDGTQLGRIIGYTENYADADRMAARHVVNVNKVQAKIDEYDVIHKQWVPLVLVSPSSIDSNNKPQYTSITPKPAIVIKHD